MYTAGSYHKPYIWRQEELTYNLQENIRFELEKLMKGGRVTTHKEVVAVLTKTLEDFYEN